MLEYLLVVATDRTLRIGSAVSDGQTCCADVYRQNAAYRDPDVIVDLQQDSYLSLSTGTSK